MSRAERFALAGAVILVLLQAAAAASPDLGSALEYRHSVLAAQPWRLLTGHWVHVNWPHVLVNAAAWFVVARLFARELPPVRQLVVLLAAAVAISAGLMLAYPRIGWYRGFSGLLHGLFFAGAIGWLAQTLAKRESRTFGALWLPGALVLGGWVKVVLEQPGAEATPYAPWLDAPTVPQAHLLGAVCGTLIALAFVRGSTATATARNERE
jgi:rhomboid family GlyGly-CTERM serine protease